MGTRAVITFRDSIGRFSVYQHYDGDPETVLENIKLAKHHWAMPRFEADEYAAAYIATYKTSSGNIRLTSGPQAHGDLQFTYIVSHKEGSPELVVTYRETHHPSGKTHTATIIPE